MESIKSYRDLRVWQEGLQLVKRIYEMTISFPKDEIYGLTSQLKRAAVSIPSNIAEGHGRDSTKEYLRYISIAFGSLAELETQVTLSKELKLINEEAENNFLKESDKLGKMLRALQNALKAKLND